MSNKTKITGTLNDVAQKDAYSQFKDDPNHLLSQTEADLKNEESSPLTVHPRMVFEKPPRL